MKGKEKPILIWSCLVCCLDIFNIVTFGNLTAVKVIGLLTLPMSFHFLIRTKHKFPSYGIFFYFYLLVIGGIYFGYIDPWVDETGMRSMRTLAQGRSLLYLSNSILEFSFCIFFLKALLKHFERNRNFDYFFFILRNLILLVLGGIFAELIFRFDFYAFFSGDAPHELFRPRGFNYEPRGAGQMISLGILFYLNHTYPTKFYWLKYLVISLMLFVVAISLSITAIYLLFTGIAVYLAYLFKGSIDKRLFILKLSLKFFVILIGGFIVYSILANFNLGHDIEDMIYRQMLKLGFIKFLWNSPLSMLEAFDNSALNFLVKNPYYLLFGTGPGLVHLPATGYILDNPDIYWDWLHRIANTTPPLMGPVLIISNTGIVGILFIGHYLWKGLKNLNSYLTPKDKLNLIFIAISFAIQMRPIQLLLYAFLMLPLRSVSIKNSNRSS